MAEGLFRHLHGDDFDVYSAGSDPREVDPLAIKCMEEIGIDISGHRSKSLKEFDGQEFDYVITICGNPYNACPFFVGGKKYFKQPFEDTSVFEGTEDQKLEQFKVIRDELKFWIEDLYFSYIISEDGSCNLDEIEGCCNSINEKEFSCK